MKDPLTSKTKLWPGIKEIARFQGNVLGMESFGGKVLVATQSGVFSITHMTNIDTGEVSFLVDPVLLSSLPDPPLTRAPAGLSGATDETTGEQK